MLQVRKVSRGYQITLPRKFRDKYHLKVGDVVEYIEKDDELVIRPLQPTKKNISAKKLIEFLKNSGNLVTDLSEDEIIELASQEKQKVTNIKDQKPKEK